MEAEFIVASSTTQEAIRLRRFLRDLEVMLHASGPNTLFCDSMATIGHAKNAIHHAKTKHIDVNFNFTRNRLEEVTLESYHWSAWLLVCWPSHLTLHCF